MYNSRVSDVCGWLCIQVRSENAVLKDAAEERDVALEQLKALKDAVRQMAEQKDSAVASARKEVSTPLDFQTFNGSSSTRATATSS